MRLRRLGFGLATVLGLARRGFFIPHRYAAAAIAFGRGWRGRGVAADRPGD